MSRRRANRLAPLAFALLLSPVAEGAARAESPASAAAETDLPLRLAFQAEAAFGTLTGSFANQMTGVRLDLLFSPRVSFGGYLGYASLKGKDGRVGNALAYAQVEYLLPLTETGRVRLPLRFASGYLPRNGPIVRMTAGLAFALGAKVDLIAELFAPMFWVTNDQMLLSMNAALEIAARF